MNKRLLVFRIGVLVTSACGGGGGPTTSGPKQGEKLTIAIGVDPDTLDPMRQTTTTVQNIVQMVVETLVKVDTDGKIQPYLATSWQTATDGMSWTFTLKSGFKFPTTPPFNPPPPKPTLPRILPPPPPCPFIYPYL